MIIIPRRNVDHFTHSRAASTCREPETRKGKRTFRTTLSQFRMWMSGWKTGGGRKGVGPKRRQRDGGADWVQGSVGWWCGGSMRSGRRGGERRRREGRERAGSSRDRGRYGIKGMLLGFGVLCMNECIGLCLHVCVRELLGCLYSILNLSTR